MTFNEYAAAKLDGYKRLGFVISEHVDTPELVTFVSKDLNGTFRFHSFSDDGVVINELPNGYDNKTEVSEVKEEAPKKKRTKKA